MTTQYRVLVSGGTGYSDAEFVSYTLERIVAVHGDIVLCQGGALGADYLAREWFHEKYGTDPLTIEAEWDKYGTSAGGLRNQRMLDEFKPDLVVVFPGGPGSQDMLSRARKLYEQGQLDLLWIKDLSYQNPRKRSSNPVGRL